MLPRAAALLLLGCLLFAAIPQPTAGLRLFSWNMLSLSGTTDKDTAAAAAAAAAAPAAATAKAAATGSADGVVSIQTVKQQRLAPKRELEVVETHHPGKLSLMSPSSSGVQPGDVKPEEKKPSTTTVKPHTSHDSAEVGSWSNS